MSWLAVTDGSGVYGSLLHYVMVLFFVCSAMLVFTYLWWTGKLGMSEEPKYRMMQDDDAEKKKRRKKMTEENKEHEELELYGDPGIASLDNQVPNWLLLTYLTLPFWGLVTFIMFFNGSAGWFDRGYWHALQKAANTTFPFHNANLQELKPILKERVPVIEEGAQKMAEVLQGHKLELQEEKINTEVAEKETRDRRRG